MENNKRVPAIRFKGFTEEWKSKLLSKLAAFSKGSGYSKNDLCEAGIPIILYGRLYTQYQTAISCVDTFVRENKGSVVSKGNEVIVPASGETAEDIARASAVIRSDVILGGDLNVIYPNEDLNSIFLALSISNGSIWKELSKKAQGKSVVHLRNGDLQEVELKYPKPAEQKQIGEFFQNVDSLINVNQRKLDKLKNIKKACLEKMFPRKGSTIPEIRFKGFTEEWEEKKLGDLGEFKSNGVDKKSDINEIPVNLLNYMDVYNRRQINAFNCNTLMSVTAKPSQIKDNNILKNDIFFTPSSETPDDIGKVMVIEETLPNTVYSYHLVRYRPKENKFASLFPNYGFSCDFIRKQMIFAAQGVQRFVINKGAFEELKVMLPLKDEQEKIGAFFKNLDNLISKNELQLTKLKNIKKACLEKMFVNTEDTI